MQVRILLINVYLEKKIDIVFKLLRVLPFKKKKTLHGYNRKNIIKIVLNLHFQNHITKTMVTLKLLLSGSNQYIFKR